MRKSHVLTPIFCVAVLLVLVLKFSLVHVVGISMLPTIGTNQFTVVERYWMWQHPQRGDIITFWAPPEPTRQYCKRIIGIPGDVIRIDSSSVSLDDVTLTEPYVTLQGNQSPYQHLFVVVPPDKYFVMGDDRLYSYDSRFWGFVPRQNIVGRLVYLFGSPDNTRLLPDVSAVYANIHPIGVFQTSFTSGNAASGSVLLIGFPGLAGACTGLLRRIRRKRMPNKRTSYHHLTTSVISQRSACYQALHRVLCTGLLVLLCGCSLLPPIGHRTNTPRYPWQTPILSPAQPFRVVQVLINTPPLFPVSYVRETTALLAERVNAYISIGEDGLLLYVSWITSRSLQNEAWSLSVPAIPADPPEPIREPLPHAATYPNPYQYADAVDKVNAANAQLLDNWQAKLRSNHQLLATVRAEVRKATATLRVLVPPYDPLADDLLGGLVDASHHLAAIQGEKYLLIASPLLNNTQVNAVSTIRLTGVLVRVIMHTCIPAIASVCATQDATYTTLLRSYGAKDIQMFDVAQTEALHITF